MSCSGGAPPPIRSSWRASLRRRSIASPPWPGVRTDRLGLHLKWLDDDLAGYLFKWLDRCWPRAGLAAAVRETSQAQGAHDLGHRDHVEQVVVEYRDQAPG